MEETDDASTGVQRTANPVGNAAAVTPAEGGAPGISTDPPPAHEAVPASRQPSEGQSDGDEASRETRRQSDVAPQANLPWWKRWRLQMVVLAYILLVGFFTT